MELFLYPCKRWLHLPVIIITHVVSWIFGFGPVYVGRFTSQSEIKCIEHFFESRLFCTIFNKRLFGNGLNFTQIWSCYKWINDSHHRMEVSLLHCLETMESLKWISDIVCIKGHILKRFAWILFHLISPGFDFDSRSLRWALNVSKVTLSIKQGDATYLKQ